MDLSPGCSLRQCSSSSRSFSFRYYLPLGRKQQVTPRYLLATVGMSILRLFLPEGPVVSRIVLPALSYPYRVASSTIVPISVGCFHGVGHRRAGLESNVGTSKSAQEPQRCREVA